MSHSAEYRWQLQQAQRRERYLSRIRDNTNAFVERYERILAELREQGLDAYLPAEFSHLERQVATVRRLLISDVEGARDLSQSIAEDVHALPRATRQACKQATEQEERRRQALSSEIRSMLDTVFAKIADPVERDFAYAAAGNIRHEIAARLHDQASLDKLRADIEAQLGTIQVAARQQAQDWKAARRREMQIEVRQDVLAHARDTTMADAGRNPAALTELATAWQSLEQHTGEDADGFRQAISEVTRQTDEAVVDEECRRATVRAVYESLQKAGFAVGQPRKDGKETDAVVLLARKPSGAQAEFRVDVTGGLYYKFDHYEGGACKQDISKIMPMLQSIYGINLSQERVLWENPDRLAKDAKPIDDQEAGHG